MIIHRVNSFLRTKLTSSFFIKVDALKKTKTDPTGRLRYSLTKGKSVQMIPLGHCAHTTGFNFQRLIENLKWIYAA
jgi:hypothetical protein